MFTFTAYWPHDRGIIFESLKSVLKIFKFGTRYLLENQPMKVGFVSRKLGVKRGSRGDESLKRAAFAGGVRTHHVKGTLVLAMKPGNVTRK